MGVGSDHQETKREERERERERSCHIRLSSGNPGSKTTLSVPTADVEKSFAKRGVRG